MNILNMAVKADVFNGLIDGTTDVIYIKNTPWWKKRFIDVDTGVFKRFDIIRATCGDSPKYDYVIDSIRLVDDKFEIKIYRGEDDSDYYTENLEVENPVKEPVETDNFSSFEDSQEVENDIKENNTEVSTKNKNQDVVKMLFDKFNEFCKKEDVFVVNYPYVNIRPNGMICGSNKKFPKKPYNDLRFEYTTDFVTKYDLMSDEEYLNYFSRILDLMISGNYVFVYKNACTIGYLPSGELDFTMKFCCKKKYQFR